MFDGKRDLVEERSNFWQIVAWFILAVAFFVPAGLMPMALSKAIAPWVPLAVFTAWMTPSVMLAWFVGRTEHA